MNRSLAILMPLFALALVSCRAPQSVQPEIPVLKVINTAPVLNCDAVIYGEDGREFKSTFFTTVGKGKEFDTAITLDDVYVYDVGSNPDTSVAGLRLVIERSDLHGTVLAFDWDGASMANGVVQCKSTKVQKVQ